MKRAFLFAIALSETPAEAPSLRIAGSDPDQTRAALRAAASLPNDEPTIQHVLNRIAFGARPGDLERVKAMGLQRYVEEQLRPDRVEDAAMAGRLEGLSTV